MAGERGLAERGRLSHAQLVQHLAGLLVARVVDAPAEPGREQAQRPRGDVGREAQRLEAGDQAVAAEQRGEPGDPRRVVRAAFEVRAQQLEVEQRALEDAVEQAVVRGHADGRHRRADGRARGGPAARAALLGDRVGKLDHDRSARLELELEGELARGPGRRGRGGAHRRAPPNAVPPEHRERLAVPHWLRAVAAGHEPAQHEHRLEVRGEEKLKRETERRAVMAADRDPLAQHTTGVRLANEPYVQRQAGVAELVHRLGATRVGRGEKRRGRAGESQLVGRQEPAVPEPQAEGMGPVGRQAAVRTRQEEEVVALDHDGVG